RADREMREYAAKALEALFIEAEANGMMYVNQSSGQVLSVMSAYRSYSEQSYLHEQRKAQYASYGDKAGEMAAKIVQYPGASEHQSGLCCDMHNIPSADVSFEYQDAAKWLEENCYKFGYILRYPKDKTEITKVSYEPWHFRYVGRYHASKMHELDMCLEEYWEYLGK
ncbi:MAG: M15 family metallopeptidase, partial [Clostridia bacterium]|nr:M15 family metallopeptidase [Clostridia bacterium]